MATDQTTHPAVSAAQILGGFAAGRSRFDILKDHPGLEHADIDAALAVAKQQVRDRGVPDVEVNGILLTPADFIGFKFPQPASDRFESLVRRGKVTPLSPAEQTEVEDALRTSRIFALAMAKARLLSATG
jgi:hypothetical protein